MTLPRRILLGPGPSDVSPRVLAALGQPTIGHLDPAFLALMDALRADLRAIFRTGNELTLAMSGTGSAGMETVFVNLVEPGDAVVIGVNGVFGERMCDVAGRAGARVTRVEAPWGKPIDRDAVVDAVRASGARLAAVVHAETSTGAVTALDGLGDALHGQDCLLVVDCVTSLGGMAVEIDGWAIDAAYAGSQKCLSCPPGLSPVTLGPRAVERLRGRKTKVQSWYLDLTMIQAYWGAERAYHHTAPINMLYGLAEACRVVLEEGLEPRFARHLRAHRALLDELAALGIAPLPAPADRLPMLNAVAIPDGVDDTRVRRALLDDHGIEIGGGLGAFKGKAWRIGLMGESASLIHVTKLAAALKKELGR